jgi:hypothetical protein
MDKVREIEGTGPWASLPLGAHMENDINVIVAVEPYSPACVCLRLT